MLVEIMPINFVYFKELSYFTLIFNYDVTLALINVLPNWFDAALQSFINQGLRSSH